ncbi:SMC family ATPase [Cetobacterium sp. 2A]|uniref:AAA family ATPase n=1 Tax=Cetobacterium sp. 2A TaxID=2754723 RepID=UPI00163B6E0E|nr:SMC family ATPase [Cetobacterium sp. 2A]MBC2855598.1 SMC family ATPase [Cetobacterium sp. 2A]
MRPIKLEIEGLQSFQEKQVIDFQRLIEHGIFGIFGETGSGKSTILDAMTLALYGDVVRILESRDDKLFHLLNINSEKIYVAFEFMIGEDFYRIERTMPKKRNQNELGVQKAKIIKNKDIIEDKASSVTEVVKSILGLEMADFTRTVVLPQGKFSEFLKLKGASKADMLEKIFNMEIYGEILLNKIKKVRDQLSNEILIIKTQLTSNGNITEEELETRKQELEDLEKKKELIQQRNKEFEEIYEKKKKIYELCKEKNTENKLREKIKEEEPIKYNYEKLISDFETITNIHEFALKKNKEHNFFFSLKKNTNFLNEIETNYKNINERKISLQNQKDLITVNPEKRELLNKSKILKKEINQISKEIETSFRTTTDTISRIKTGELKIIETQEEISKINEKLEILEKNDDKELQNLREKSSILKLNYENTEYKSKITKELAQNLKEGEACPVCGSNHHPSPSEEISKEFDEKLLSIKLELDKTNENIEIEKTNLNNNNKNKNILQNKLSEYKILLSQCEEKMKFLLEKKEIEEKNHEYLLEKSKNLNSNLKELPSEYNSISFEELELKYLELLSFEKEKIELEKKISLEEINLKKVSEKKDEIKEVINQNNLDLATIQVIIEKDEKLIDSISHDQSVQCSISLTEEERVRNWLKDFSERVTENNLKIKSLEEKLSGEEVTEEEYLLLVSQKNENENDLESLKNEILLKNREIIEAEKSKNIAQELQKDLDKIMKKDYEYESLSGLFKGKKFIKFLSLNKLKNIVFMASKRLNNITKGKYGLVVDENTDFLIVDNFNGGIERRAATLSGGETFLVSLALALALSNQIQLKGKTQLEFFFLDEGFGTLDTKLLDKVIESLEHIKEHEKIKVGIISHVEELKTRVPRKLEVLSPISGISGSIIKME